MAKQFGSGAAFKTSVEARLRKRAKEQKVPFSTLQLKFAMERLLARLFRNPNPPWLLKGGFAMDLRFRPQARTTKDVDLAIGTITVGAGAKLTAVLRDWLQEAADHDLGDYVSFPQKGGVHCQHNQEKFAGSRLLQCSSNMLYSLRSEHGDCSEHSRSY